MSTTLITILIAVFSVALMILALSLTLLIKKRPLQSEVGDNDYMKSQGIECTTTTMLREEAVLRGEDPNLVEGCISGSCISCTTEKDCP